MQPNIEDFRKLKTIPIRLPDETKEDGKLVKENYKNKVGRSQVTHPWKNKNLKLPDNYKLSVGRLKSLYKNLNHNPELLTKYDEVIQYKLSKGTIKMVTGDKEERGGNLQTVSCCHQIGQQHYQSMFSLRCISQIKKVKLKSE